MNSKHTTLLIASILAFALLTANVNVGSVYATGGLDDEEEEEAIQELQNNVLEIKEALGVIELNLTEGTNNIQANCPLDQDEIVEEVKEVVKNITEEIKPTCPFAPEQNVTQQPEPEPEPAPVQNTTCPFAPVEPDVPVVEENVTEVIEEVIENVTNNQPTCNIPKEIIPQINITEPEPEPIPEPVQNVTEPEPVQNVTEPEPDVPVCPFTGEPIVQPEQPEQEQPVQDEQEVASIEFEASCGCFVVDKSPEDTEGTNNSGANDNTEFGIGNPEDQEQGLYY